MSKGSYLHEYLTNLPDFIFDYIEIYYTGESINTQIGYCIDLRIFLEYLQKFRFKSVEKLEDFTCEHMGEVKAQDIIRFKAYLKEYESTYISPDGKKVTRTRRNSSFGINRKLLLTVISLAFIVIGRKKYRECLSRVLSGGRTEYDYSTAVLVLVCVGAAILNLFV